MAGRAANDRHKLIEAEVAKNKLALAEYDRERTQKRELAKASADMSQYDLGGYGPTQPGAAPLPAGVQGPVIHKNTGAPDYRDPQTLQDRIAHVGLLAEGMSSDEARAAFLADQRDFLHGEIVKVQEADAIDGLANSVQSLTTVSGLSKNPALQSMAQELIPRFQEIEKAIRGSAHLPAAVRSQVITDALKQKADLLGILHEQSDKMHRQTDAVAALTQAMDALPLGDPQRITINDAITAIAGGGDPEKIANEYAFKKSGYVKMPDGGWYTKDQADINIKAQQEAAKQANEKADREEKANKQKFDYQKEANAQRETRRHNRAMENRPFGEQLDTPLDIEKGAIEKANALHGKIDAQSTPEDRARWKNTYEAFINQIRDEPQRYGGRGATGGKKRAPKKEAPDLQSKFDSMSEDDKAAYLKAAGLK